MDLIHDENVHLKILQLSLTILNSTSYDLDQAILSKVNPLLHVFLTNVFFQLLKICFALHSSQKINVQFTAAATIRQANNFILEKLINIAKNFKDDKVSVTDDPQFLPAKNALLYFQV